MNSGLNHYRKARAKLVELYEIMTQRYFTVIAPRYVFLTTEQLERLEKNPPVCGLEPFTRNIEMDVSIERIINAYEIGDDSFEMGFRYPSRDISVIYETIQESIRLWIDVKINSYGYKTADLKELRAMELVAKRLFYAYSFYYKEEVNSEIETGTNITESGFANMYLGMLKYGREDPTEISFVSYIDNYLDKINESANRSGIYIDNKSHINVQSFHSNTNFEIPKMHHPLRNWG